MSKIYFNAPNLHTVKWDPTADAYMDESKVFDLCGNSLKESRSGLDEAVHWTYERNANALVFIASIDCISDLCQAFPYFSEKHPVMVHAGQCEHDIYVMSKGYIHTHLGQFSLIQDKSARDEVILTGANSWSPFWGVGDWGVTCRIVNWR